MRLQPLPARVDNYIWIVRDALDRALVVDPSEAQPVIAAAAASGFTPVVILLTHHHDDHIAGAAPLLQRWPGLPVYGPDDDRIRVPMHCVADGDTFEVAGWRIKALDVPGHTSSHVAFVVTDDEDEAPALFCGHIVQPGLRSPFRRHARADGCIAGDSRRAAACHPRLLRARVHAGQRRICGSGRT